MASRSKRSPEVEEPLHRRAELVRACYDLIAKKGLEGLRTRDVAARVRINISTLHYHFESKERLLAAVVGHVMHLFKTMHAPLPATASALDEVRHLLRGQSRARRERSRVDVVMHELMLRSRRDREIRTAFRALLVGWRAVVERIIARGLRDRTIRADADPKTVAAILTSFTIGANMQLGMTPTTLSLDASARAFVTWLARAKRPASARSRRSARRPKARA